uniref:RBR-type E3 ubiquitin transferase n=1 Tax=Kalanchoe fedtschenkoi TaxID=63787 RepID=A0A7N0VB44_KALFE
MLAFEALTLRKKLVHFDITLVGRNEIDHAFRLAREAIVSHIRLPEETKTGKKIVETCVICMEDKAVSNMFMIDGCLHRYCFSCMKQHVEVKLLNGKIAQCPHENCNSEVPLESCKSLLEPKFVDIVIQRLKEAALPPTEKVYCPYPRCSALMSKKEVMDSSANYLNDPKLVGMSKCTKCRKRFCRKCMVPWHRNMRCKYYQRCTAYIYRCAEDRKLKFLAKQKHWRQCVKCSNKIELAEGCNHIYCRCGYELCYTCGPEWKNKKVMCSCPLWSERNIIRR